MWWTSRNVGGPRRVNHAAVAIGDKVYSFGGYCTGDNYKDKIPIDVFILNSTTHRWSALSKPCRGSSDYEDWPIQRYGHSVSARKDEIFLFGGRNATSLCATLYVFNVNTLQWTKPKVGGAIPNGRDGHTSTIIGDELFICGGYEYDMLTQFVCKLNLNTLIWSIVWTEGTGPIYRDFHTATIMAQDKLLIFGGRCEVDSHESYPVDVHCLDIKTMVWHSPTIRGLSPKGRRSHSAVNVNGNLLIFGGYNYTYDEHYNDVWILDTKTWTWKEIVPFGSCGPKPRRRQVMCRIPDDSRIFIFGGTSPYKGPPIHFTQEQLQCLLSNDEEYFTASCLIDLNDTCVLDLHPSLKTICLSKVIEYNLPRINLPVDIRQELDWMTKRNNISQPLKTLPLG